MSSGGIMAKWLITLSVWTVAILGASYYWLYKPQAEALNDARREASTSLQEVSALRGEIADLEELLRQLEETSTELEGEIAIREQELAAVRSTQDELMGKLEQEIANGQIQVERLRGQLRVDLVDEVLFDSGEAELNPAGLQVLEKISAVLKKAEGKNIVVHGHTDNVTIVGKLAETFPTNWELSAARAVNVARFLQETGEIKPERLSATAFSEYQPRVDNTTEKGRKQNRRIEIVLAPAPIPVTATDQPGETKEEG
jgi:chemotaxis protein MotB